MKTVGIIGGMGPEATLQLYKKIIRLTAVAEEKDHIHVIIDSNPKTPDRTSYLTGRGISPLNDLLSSLRRLEQIGAEVFAMPCNTAHAFYSSLQSETKYPFINMIDGTVKYALTSRPKSTRFGLLATKGTYRIRLYEKYFNQYNKSLFIPDESIQNKLMTCIYEKKSQPQNMNCLKTLPVLVEDLRQFPVDTWILGCTELPLILPDYLNNIDFIDSLDVLAHLTILTAGYVVK